jgi:hypothetical protein
MDLLKREIKTVDNIVAPLKETIAKLTGAKDARTAKVQENDEKILEIQAENVTHHEEMIRAERIKTKLEELLS